MITLYGLKACETTRAAARWLDRQGLPYVFRDVRKDGLDEARLREWVGQLGWDKVLNRMSTTWRNLPETQKAGLEAGSAVRLMMAHPTLIKRPVLEYEGRTSVGFSPEAYKARLS
jgi:arsenate reductase